MSRLFLYYNIRALEGTTAQDVGAYIQTGISALVRYGICEESIWPYDTNKLTTRPSLQSYINARHRSVINYKKILSLDGILDAINNNYPVPFGMAVYEDFADVGPLNAVIRLPSKNEQNVGAHAMCMIGYDLNKKTVLAKNSFGTEWGSNGYCWIPFEYVIKEVYDVWVFDLYDKTDPFIKLPF